MPSEEKYFNLYDYKLFELSLVNSKGNFIPLHDYYEKVTIKESIYEPYMSANISLVDANNLPAILPIVGNEQLVVSFKTPKFADRTITLAFNSSNMPLKKVSGNQKTQFEELTFVSNTWISGVNKRISDSYEGTISQMVSDIIDDHVLTFDERPPSISGTDEKFKYNMPFVTPFQAINMLKRKAYKKRKNITDAGFLFFENSNGLNFVSLHELKTRGVKVVLNYGRKNSRNGAEITEERFNSGELLEPKRSFNRALEMSSGIYGGAITRYDLTKKKIESKIVTIEQMETPENLLNKHTLHPSEIKYIREGLFSNNIVNTEAFAQDDIEDNSKIFDLHLERQIDILRSRGNVITLRVAGNSDLNAGDVIRFETPALVNQEKSSGEDDTLVSGNYIISKLDHVITKTKYYCNLELIKDSIIEELLPASE